MMGLQVAADIWAVVMERFNDENRAGVEGDVGFSYGSHGRPAATAATGCGVSR